MRELHRDVPAAGRQLCAADLLSHQLGTSPGNQLQAGCDNRSLLGLHGHLHEALHDLSLASPTHSLYVLPTGLFDCHGSAASQCHDAWSDGDARNAWLLHLRRARCSNDCTHGWRSYARRFVPEYPNACCFGLSVNHLPRYGFTRSCHARRFCSIDRWQ